MVVLDASNYDSDTWNPPCLKAAGVERVIMGCQRPSLASPMIVAARNARIEVRDLYAFLYFGIDTIGQVNGAIAVAKDLGGIDTIWLDCESTGDLEAKNLTPPARIADLANCVNLVRSHGYRAGIYTGAWWWPSYMGNTTQFSGLPLWHAAYGPNSGPADPIREVNYGGWREVAIHQYTSTLNLCGRGRDANYVFEEADMADPRVDAIIAALGGQDAIDQWNANGNSLLLGYALEQQKLADHLDGHPAENAQAGTKVLPHKHTMGIAISETGGVSP